MASRKLFLLDGHALVYRAHFAFINRPLINSKGINTSAIAGFVRTLWDIMQSDETTHIAVAFDPDGPTFRHERYEPYKANREEQPEDIAVALPYIRKIVEAFRIPVVMVKGFEADDVIGTLAKQAEQEGFDVFMVTPDKDYAQLVSQHIFMYKPSRQGNGVEVLGVPEVLEKWDIQQVDQVVDMLGLQGDSVDNIPGIPGIGPKTASRLLADYHSVEELIERADELKGKQQERVKEFADQALLSKELARIDINVPIQFNADTYIIEPFDREALSELFRELEFRSLANSILGEAGQPQGGVQGDLFNQQVAQVHKPSVQTPPQHSVADRNINNTPHTYHLVDTPEKCRDLATLLSGQEAFCFDSETTSIDANQAELVGISFALKAGEAWYVPMSEDSEEVKATLEIFRPLFEDASVMKIAQNAKYDMLVLKWYGIEVKGFLLDTMLVHYLLEPELRHNMDYLAETYLKYQPVPIENLIGRKGKNQLSMRDVAVEKVVEYAAEDADITLQISEKLFPDLQKEGLEALYKNIEEPLISVLADMEYQGINLDVPFLEAYSLELECEASRVEQLIYSSSRACFNIASPKQVGEILFEKMKIPYRWGKTKSGQYSTNEEKLQELAEEFPLVNDILTFRGLLKLKSTYVDALPRMVNPKTGRVHTSYNQALAATGRLSSQNPNLQNIPIRTPQGRKVREAFIPRNDDFELLAADYSQIELRLIAEISGDEAMLDAFINGQDIHRATAARVYEVDYESVTPEQRRNAKTVNFSIIYGAGATNLSRQLNLKRSDAQDLISQYFKQYNGLKAYMENSVKFARDNGYVTTLMGRRRYLRDINSRSSLMRGNAERMAINTPIQGSAADMIKIAMIKIQEYLKSNACQTRMILQVHDELVFDVHREEKDTLQPVIVQLMREALPNLKVPIQVDAGSGRHWLEAH